MFSKTQILYYGEPETSNPVKRFIDSLQKRQKAKVFRIFEAIEQYGLEVVSPHIKQLKSTPLWEIRLLGQDNIRLLYVIRTKNMVIILHGFVKKTQKTPQKEINTAMKRYNTLEI